MRGLSAPTSLANLERERGQPRSGWGVGEVADTTCARCVSRHAPTDARYWRWYKRAVRTSLYHRQYAGFAIFWLALSRVTTRAYSSLDARYLRYAGVGGWLFAYRAVRPARRDMQIHRRPRCRRARPLSEVHQIRCHRPALCQMVPRTLRTPGRPL